MSEADQDYRLRELRAVLDRRIDSLEKANGRLRVAGWAGPILGGAAMLVAGLTASRTADAYEVGTVAPALEAEALILRDDFGVERAAFRIAEDGGASLALQDQDGRPRLRFEVLSDGSPGVSLLDAEGESHAILGLLADGTTTLVFADAGSVARTVLALTPDGAARLVFSDQLGQTRAAMGVDGSGRAEVSTTRDEPQEQEEEVGPDEGSGSDPGA
jgi:hypothetical protein